MLTDPQALTINGVAKSLPAVNRGAYSSEYRESNGEHKFNVSSTWGKRDRSVIKLTATKDATDPYTTNAVEVSSTVYLVMDRPKYGFTNSEIDHLVQGLTAWLTSANVEDVLGGES